MAFEQRKGDGVLFHETEKRSEKAPDMKGKIMCHACGVEAELAAWTKQGRKGEFLSVRMSEPWRKPEPDSSEPF